MTGDSPGCPVCGSRRLRFFAKARDVEYYTSHKMFAYQECADCASVFLESPPVDQLRLIYPPNYDSYQAAQGSDSFLECVKARLDLHLFDKLLAQIPGESLKVLDVGGGSGWLLTLVRKASNRVQHTHEIDFDEGAKSAAELAGHAFHCCWIEEFSSDQKFDLILMLNLIEHVSDPRAVLSAMRNLLSPGGLILIKTPNVDTLDCRLFRNHNWGGFHCPRPFRALQSRVLNSTRTALRPQNRKSLLHSRRPATGLQYPRLAWSQRLDSNLLGPAIVHA